MIRFRSRAARLLGVLSTMAFALGGGLTSAQHSPEKLAEWFFTTPRLSGIRLSPSGDSIAALYSENGKEMIVVRELGGGNPTPLVALPDPEARLRWLEWVSEERILFATEEPIAGTSPPRPRRTRLYAINRDGKKHVHLARNWAKSILVGRGEFQYEDQVIDLLEKQPNQVLIAIRKPTEYYPGVYKLNVVSGGLEPVVPLLEGVLTWHTDHHGKVRAGTGLLHGKTRFYARLADGPFEEIATSEYLDETGISFAGFAFDTKTLYVSKGKSGYSALYEFDLTTKTLGEELLAVEGFDVPSWLEFDDDRKRLIAAGYAAESYERHFFDAEAKNRQEALNRALPKTFNQVVSENRDGSVAVVSAHSDTSPPTFYLFSKESKQLSFLFSSAPAVGGLDLAPMKAISYTARDGRSIPAYLTVPRGGEGPKPLIVLPHGGPSARDVWGYDSQVQFLAALGFAVLQPNFRGSTGYGNEHQTAGFREWGLAMQDDVSDGVQWLIDTAVADPKRICLFGSSYGGYTALMGLVKTPELFRCAASYAGVTDLVMMLNHDKGYMFSELNLPTVGSTTKDRGRLKDNSPLQNIEKIDAPVFLAHGEDDERVHVAHSQKLAKQLEKAGKPVLYLELEDEAHAFRDERNRIRFFTELGKFLLENTTPPRDVEQAAISREVARN